jgi:hypothetical protein
MKKLFKIEEYDAYIKAGVVSFETARDISFYYPYRAKLSYYSREALKEDIPDKYKKYEDWYAHEIRDELPEDVCDLILEEVWGLHEMGCANREFEGVYAAPTLQEVVNWLIEDRGVVVTVAFLNKSRKWVYRTQSMLGEHLQLNDNIENYTSTEQFNTWQEALDTGIRDMVLNTNADCVMKGKWNKPK